MTRVGYAFVPAPRHLSLAWSECSFFERAVAGEVFRCLGGAAGGFRGDWRDAVCSMMAVPGKERPNVKRALSALEAKGLIVVEKHEVHVLFSDAQVAVRSLSGGGQVAVRSLSGGGQVEVSSELNPGNHSGHDLQKERKSRSDQTERERAPEQAERPLPEHPNSLQTPGGTVRVEFERRFVAKRGVPPGWPQKAIQACAAISGWVDTIPAQEGALARLLDAFFADSWAEGRGYPIAALANDPPRYWSPPQPVAEVVPMRRTAEVVREELRQAGLRYDVEACKRLKRELDEIEDAEDRRSRYGRR